MAPSLASELAPSPCPDVEEWMAFALGKLAPELLEATHEHLDACTACQRVLSDAAHALGTALTTQGTKGITEGELEWNTTFQRGTLVGGRYEIREFIARGGMGEVYEAFDRELRERVALKTVSSTACDNLRAVKRLKAEVQLARRVSHPNVCRIYDFGSHALPGGAPPVHFLTMEFVEGETLGQRIRLAGAVPEAEARKIARDLVLGLRAAHEAGVLHRDFKSDNVMLKAGPDGQSNAVILDFGLARALDHAEGASGSNSQVVGTLGYIAPERFDGRPYTTASDVYAFGVVWFEMLTGELPFSATLSSAAGSGLRTIDRPLAPSRLNRSVPTDVDHVVLRCLERTPGARYKTAGEILRGLDAIATSSDSVARRARALGVLLSVCVAIALLYLLASTQQRPHAGGAGTAAVPALESKPPRASSPDPSPAPRDPPAASLLAPAPVPPAAAPPHALSAALSPARRFHPPAVAERPQRGGSPTSSASAAPPTPSEAAVVQALPAGAEPSRSPVPASRSLAPLPSASPSRRPAPKPDWENPFSALEPPPVAEATAT